MEKTFLFAIAKQDSAVEIITLERLMSSTVEFQFKKVFKFNGGSSRRRPAHFHGHLQLIIG